MGGIFVSYRRSDSQGEAGRLFDDLVPIFGEHTVFMDVSAIEAGRDFRRAIEAGVTQCGVLLAVMGPEWLNAKDEAGASRLNNPADFVRIETASALKRDIPVIPVLVRGARMPSAEQLPEDLKELAYRNCIELTHARWKSDMQLLVEALRRLLGEASQAGEVAVSGRVAAPREEGGPAPIDPAVLQRVGRELGFYIGQIAEIVVRRTASHCISVEELYLKVAEEIDSPSERRQFLKDRVPSTSLPEIAKTAAQASNAPATLEALPLAEGSGLVRPSQPATGKPSSSRRKYWLLACGAGVFLILVVVIGKRFAPSGGGSYPTAQTPPQEAHIADSAPLAETPSKSHKPVPLPPTSSPSESEPASPKRVTLSEEVSRDLLITKVSPVYPALARQAHIQGVVVLDADISQDGLIETLRAVSGHPMLVPAAVEAAKQFRYRPYSLNGKQVGVNTQIVFRFTLSGG